jgi:hypothetical protein
MNSIGRWHSILLISIMIYSVIYGLSIRRAAVNDSRNQRGDQTIKYMYLILWERLLERDPLAIIYVICLPIFILLFFHGVLNLPRHIK